MGLYAGIVYRAAIHRIGLVSEGVLTQHQRSSAPAQKERLSAALLPHASLSSMAAASSEGLTACEPLSLAAAGVEVNIHSVGLSRRVGAEGMLPEGPDATTIMPMAGA